ncbi:MAG: hypothetical protein Unbinned4294contig1001_20 [Prokaryotic dsDNA virus sp.]|jgi:hypothetical protein|nr:MAG: hypothetical protein Unbinned4294contig1001_20 [Prokaryotic dsDNA virus sp.]|tara:strand:+ start:9134 stop:11752 length:2619 start_codon:yes stop_codon:yes gene_type:complete
MSRKQTLKSLLGANDERVEVDLNLDEQTFRAPTVKAGDYQVAAPVYSKTNSLLQLSNALERYSGPILKGYANIREQQSLAMADATELLTNEQLELLNTGDSSGLVESINNDKRQIDEAQRKKLISFAENPNNYERAYRRVGSRVAGVFTEDFLTNMDKYAEDESFNFQNKADELAKQYGLNGLGEQEFYKQINSISEATKARFGELKNAHLIRTDKAEAIADQSMQMINGTFNTDVIAEGGFYDAMAGKTLAQQEAIVQGMVTKLATDHPKKALELIESYETGVIALGNGVVRDEFLISLQDTFANAEERQRVLAGVTERKRDESITEFKSIYSNAIILGQDIPESTDIFINDGLTITVDTSEVRTAADVARAVADAVADIPESDKTISEGTKAEIVKEFTNEVVKEQQRIITLRSNAGVNAAAATLLEQYSLKDSNGDFVHPDASTPLERANKVAEDMEELNPIIDAIDADPNIPPSEKPTQARMAVMKFLAEKSERNEKFAEEKEESLKALRFEELTGGDQEEAYQGIIDKFYASASEDADPITALIEGQSYLEKARAFDAETDRLREEIRNREMTDEEVASGMTSEQFFQKKIKEAKDLNADRAALLQADLAVDDKLDGRTKESQQPEAATETQDKLAKETTTSNVIVHDRVSGFATTNIHGRRSRKPDVVANRAARTRNLIQDITTPRGEGNIFNQGIQDSYNANMMVARIDDPNVTNMHEAHLYNAKAYQAGEEMKVTPFDALRDHDEVGTKMVANFMHAEPIIRAARDGEAGITINELQSQDLKGVKFNPLTLNQSATPILPFSLLNKAFTDSNNLTPQEEQRVRDYADALYDMSQQDEAGREEIINEMIKRQVNAYSRIGFRFLK